MGSKMCIHLVKGGHAVSGYDINKKLIDELVDKGIKREDSISEISKNKDIIILFLIILFFQEFQNVCLVVTVCHH